MSIPQEKAIDPMAYRLLANFVELMGQSPDVARVALIDLQTAASEYLNTVIMELEYDEAMSDRTKYALYMLDTHGRLEALCAIDFPGKMDVDTLRRQMVSTDFIPAAMCGVLSGKMRILELASMSNA